MTKIDVTNGIERNFYNISIDLAEFLTENNISVEYDESGEGRYYFFKNGDLIHDCNFDEIESLKYV